jgi:hypothetical protein
LRRAPPWRANLHCGQRGRGRLLGRHFQSWSLSRRHCLRWRRLLFPCGGRNRLRGGRFLCARTQHAAKSEHCRANQNRSSKLRTRRSTRQLCMRHFRLSGFRFHNGNPAASCPPFSFAIAQWIALAIANRRCERLPEREWLFDLLLFQTRAHITGSSWAPRTNIRGVLIL